MAAHGIPYVATLAAGSLPMLKDFRAKVERAALTPGFRFLHVLGGCPPGWRYPTADSTEIMRLAVESRYFPLVEVDDGTWRITFRPKHPVPVRDFLATQGRFALLSRERDRRDPVARRRALGAARELLPLAELEDERGLVGDERQALRVFVHERTRTDGRSPSRLGAASPRRRPPAEELRSRDDRRAGRHAEKPGHEADRRPAGDEAERDQPEEVAAQLCLHPVRVRGRAASSSAGSVEPRTAPRRLDARVEA